MNVKRIFWGKVDRYVVGFIADLPTKVTKYIGSWERDRVGERRGVEKNCLSKRKRSVMSPKEWPVSEISGEWWNPD